jgi:spore germination cell wall hydrolase CwlJ-like protein
MFRHILRLTVILTLFMLSACTSLPQSVSQTAPLQLPQMEQIALTVTPIEPDLSVAVILPDVTITNPTLQMRARVRLTDAEVRCLATTIYFEAKSEPEIGQIGVGYVMLNRMADSRFPDTLCGVAHQKDRGRCQFSWYCDRVSDVPKNQEQYGRAERVARAVILGEVANPIGGNLFFHATYVNKRKTYAGEIRLHGHRFYGAARDRAAIAQL